MKQKNEILYVGALQEMAEPTVSLYVDEGNTHLYIALPLKQGIPTKLIALPVYASEITSYLAQSNSLQDMLRNRPILKVSIYDGEAQVDGAIDNLRLNDVVDIQRYNVFDPDLCNDEVWIETFLSRFNTHQPLEIA